MKNGKRVIIVGFLTTVMSLGIAFPSITVTAQEEYPEAMTACVCDGVDGEMGIAYITNANSLTCNYAFYNATGGACIELKLLRRNKFEEPTVGTIYHFDSDRGIYVKCSTAKPTKLKVSFGDIVKKVIEKIKSIVTEIIFKLTWNIQKNLLVKK